MKTRLVKKFSAIAKNSPGRFKKMHMQYLMKSWRAAYRRLTDAQEYALSKTFIAFEYYNEFQRLIALRAKKPAPMYAPGTHQITDWQPGTPIQRGEFVLMPDGSVHEPIATTLKQLS